MVSNDEGERTSSAHYTEMVVRTLRHEVGDLLQSVYSAVAILQERLPRGQSLERTILADLRSRAEACKNELDAAHDLVCPLTPSQEWVELGELASGIAASFSLRYPGLRIVCEVPRPVQVWGDRQRLAQAATLLLMSLCPAARSSVSIHALAEPTKGTIEWSFCHDGPALNDEQRSWLKAPFSTTRHARFGLGLAFARRIVELLGGHIRIGESSENGSSIVLVLPLEYPKE